MTLAQGAVTACISFIVSVATIGWLRSTHWSRRLADVPNARSLHVAPVARVGGLGILAGAIPVAAWHAPLPLCAILACAVGLLGVSLADDLRSQPIVLRLAAHLLAAAIAVTAMTMPLPQLAVAGWIECTLGAMAIVWMTNLFNFMDGTDGLAGGMGAIGFAALAFAAASAGATPLSLACVALAAACAGFLVYNFPPARVFMGDAGSIPLGFLAGALGLHGVLSGAWQAWFPLLVFSPFIIDATVTLLRRLVAGERVWIAHRSHAYQRLILAGWTPRSVASRGYALMAACALTAVAIRPLEPMLQCGIIFGWAAIYALLLVAIERNAGFSPR
jgi:UDP-GlcNAc:undecaprenyl-phosphate GlcNAc-1-phosphate transferase